MTAVRRPRTTRSVLHHTGTSPSISDAKLFSHGENILLVNPWIHDFSAYDLWAKPLGLFIIAGILRERGMHVHVIDCLGLHSKDRGDGRGKFPEEIIPQPKALSCIRRFYRRYGISGDVFLSRLKAVPPPDAVLVTSGMTYWYPGVFDAIRIIRETFPRTTIILGGIYASLCPDHAREHSGADAIIEGGDLSPLFALLGLSGLPPGFSGIPTPDDPLEKHESACLLTTRGCPFRCTYCAAHRIQPRYERRSPEKVIQEIETWREHGVRHFVFYDDALLINPEEHIIPILTAAIDKGPGCSFHAPNGLHIRGMTEELAALMRRAGFRTIRIGFESSRPDTQAGTGQKLTNEEFIDGVRALRSAGFRRDEIGVYVLAGLPGQEAEEARESIEFVKSHGGRPIIAEYSPIPRTDLWEDACRASPFPLAEEPLCHNNTILPCRWEKFTLTDLQKLKDLCRDIPCRESLA